MIPENKNTANVLRRERIIRIITKSLLLVLIPITFLHLTLIEGDDKAPGGKLPFEPGEKMTYKGT